METTANKGLRPIHLVFAGCAMILISLAIPAIPGIMTAGIIMVMCGVVVNNA